MQVREYRPFIGYNFAVAIRYASVSMLLHAAICPHSCKLIDDWLSGLALVCACFTFQFLTS